MMIKLSCWYIVFLSFFHEGQMVEPKPEFLAPLENHTVTQGSDVYFTCAVDHLHGYRVAWIKPDRKAILAIHTHMITQTRRLSVTHNGLNMWKLHIPNVQKNDSGSYMCQINTDPMRSQIGYLEVVTPPDILNGNESTESSGVAVEGGTIRLNCHTTGVPTPTVSWRREDGQNIILRHEGREKQVLQSFNGETLVLTNVNRSDMGVYLCIESTRVPPPVRKRFMVRVHFHPLIRVPHRLTAAPIGSDVLVQCYVEASPRSTNYWMRDNGEKLITSEKYSMEESTLNDHSVLMNLTIRNLEEADFGGYICTSTNALGKAEGIVRLLELHLVAKSASITSAPPYIETKPRKVPHREKPHKWKQSREEDPADSRSADEDNKMTTLDFAEIRTQLPPKTCIPASQSASWLKTNRSSLPSNLTSSMVLVCSCFLILKVYMR